MREAKGRLGERACREMLDDERIDDERVSEGTQLKQGGRVHTPYSKVGGWGAAVSRDAQPNLCRRCFTTVPNLGRPKTTPGVTVQTPGAAVCGEWNQTTPHSGVRAR